jgi:hypothetical protein
MFSIIEAFADAGETPCDAVGVCFSDCSSAAGHASCYQQFAALVVLQERKAGPLQKGGTLSGAAAAGKVCIVAGTASDICSSHILPTAAARSACRKSMASAAGSKHAASLWIYILAAQKAP